MADDPHRSTGFRRALEEQLLRTRQLLDGHEVEAAEAVLSQVTGAADAEGRITAELADHPPLAAPDAFPGAHRRTMQALEVLERDGARGAQVAGFGAVAPVVAYGVEQVAAYILATFARDIVQTLRILYARRTVQCAPESAARSLLMRARDEVVLVAPDAGGGGAFIKVLIGSVAVPVVGWLAQASGAIDLTNGYVWLGSIAALAVLYVVLAWLLLQGAALAHRRSRLIMQPSLAGLWETIGHCGSPPTDDSRSFAMLAITLTALVWFVLPALAIAVVLLF